MGSTQRYLGPADLPSRISLFPLRGALLLPRATLPLNIFEPRYLAMVNDALSGSRIIGVVQPDSREGEDESPEGKAVSLRRVGCAGRITAYDEQDDGRIHITLTGIARFELLGEASTDTPYRVGAASYDRFTVDFNIGHGEEMIDRENLLRVLRLYLDAKRLEADWQMIARLSSEFLVNALSVMSPYGPEEKQALLEASDLKARCEVLIALAEMELAQSGQSGGTLQ